jgi:hypothetical protein
LTAAPLASATASTGDALVFSLGQLVPQAVPSACAWSDPIAPSLRATDAAPSKTAAWVPAWFEGTDLIDARQTRAHEDALLQLTADTDAALLSL